MTNPTSPSQAPQSPEQLEMFKVPNVFKPVPDPEKAGWRAIVNEQMLEGVTSLHLVNESRGLDLEYGQTEVKDQEGKVLFGYDVWKFHEPGGGGSVTVPYAWIENQLYLGVVKQNRPNLGGIFDELPRGFLNIGETHMEGAIREGSEELATPIDPDSVFEIGREKNPNSAFLDTSRPGEGVSFIAFELTEDQIEKTVDENGVTHYRVIADVKAQAKSKEEDGILSSELVLHSVAIKSPDMFTAAGAGLLLSHFMGENVLVRSGLVTGPATVAHS